MVYVNLNLRIVLTNSLPFRYPTVLWDHHGDHTGGKQSLLITKCQYLVSIIHWGIQFLTHQMRNLCIRTPFLCSPSFEDMTRSCHSRHIQTGQ